MNDVVTREYARALPDHVELRKDATCRDHPRGRGEVMSVAPMRGRGCQHTHTQGQTDGFLHDGFPPTLKLSPDVIHMDIHRVIHRRTNIGCSLFEPEEETWNYPTAVPPPWLATLMGLTPMSP